MKKIIPLIMLFNLSAFARDYKNPYVNKSIETHTKEFLAFELLSDFHKAVEKYNSDRKDLPEAKLIENYYVISDGKNTIRFNINLSLMGNFQYNNEILNTKDILPSKLKKRAFFSLINDAEASDQNLSSVLLAALIKLDSSIQISNADNRQLLVDKIKIIHNECIQDNQVDTPQDHSTVTNMEKLLNQINSNGKDRPSLLHPLGADEESIVNKFLSKSQAPNCANVSMDVKEYGNMGGTTKTRRAIEEQSNGSQLTAIDGSPLELSDNVKNNILADKELCAQLAQLKSCLASEKTGLTGNDTSRKFLKEKVHDDISPYMPTNAILK
jgi:hypothetical protein